eukprot:1484135-Alexandrium_andersonii.AAC.1
MSWAVYAMAMSGFGNWSERARARAQRKPVADSPKNRKSRASVTYGPSAARMTWRSESSLGGSSRISYGSFQTGASKESMPRANRRTAPSPGVRS